ncbi:MAG TPA: lysine--tRNA ligase [Thermoplasmata archaeon]|nr:lysine--tRNA ligase [Thermoplasmata archaeon]
MTPDEESHLIRERREKVERLRREQIEPYPWAFPARRTTAEVVALCRSLTPGGPPAVESVGVAGRLRAVRVHGGTAFADLYDQSGDLQLFLRREALGAEPFDAWLARLDPGDIVGARGPPVVTKRGEPSLDVRELSLLAKALHPPPEKWHGLKDPEARLRQRYVDLLASADTRSRFLARSVIVRELRSFLEEHGFVEVETAVLTPVASGAAAQPFVTHSNYLDHDVQLRIAIELALKRLIVGGLERVFEVGRCFRNEDLDTTHSPEFTMLELYWAYADYVELRAFIERLYERLAQALRTRYPDLPAVAEAAREFTPPFATLDFVEALERESGVSGLVDMDAERLHALARSKGATLPTGESAGRYLDKLFEQFVEPTLHRPTFVLDHPAATTPLAKRHRSRPGRVERFELFYRGVELGNAYTELNDPDEQEARFRAQLGGGDAEAYRLDADFVEALRYGMPPTAGFGAGVDRMAMALLGIPSIKDVILFPLARELR